VTFKEYNNELNLTLIPQEKSVPGFDFPMAAFAILIIFMIACFCKKEMVKAGITFFHR
jgi:hypothetical protein